jgi:hypothetical protein
MHAEVAMVGGAVKAEVDAERYGCPCWIVLSAVEADLWSRLSVPVRNQRQGRGAEVYLVGRLRLELLEDFLRLLLGSKSSAHLAGLLWKLLCPDVMVSRLQAELRS